VAGNGVASACVRGVTAFKRGEEAGSGGDTAPSAVCTRTPYTYGVTMTFIYHTCPHVASHAVSVSAWLCNL